ncbi:hypothetical protein CIPAW_04G072800 [Carya illinoinensis]|uniref:Protein FAR1-RELATED SEQUENCE n=1 Tax=Carya illinoinensis TaxID=32201 RepID=A0A8T1QQR7_CARIL|nr:hypothetical protein CIPAW_04G072800 [Carya illinoinensis]
MCDFVEEVHNREGGAVSSSKRDVVAFEEDTDFEPCNGIEFESHEVAYSFYQEYAKSMGFTTSIKNSRRSKKSKEFIDAKFACSRYGFTLESDSGNCKASMHMKRRPNGKRIIYEFLKEHNHELLPALAYHFRIHRNIKLAEKNNIDILHSVSERTRKMYVEMSRQSGRYQDIGFLQSDTSYQFDKGQQLTLDEGDAQVMLEYFKRIQKENPNFFYAMDLNEEQRLRNLFWVDAKSRHDYVSFKDAVSFDTSYIKNNEKLPFAPFVGVNHHSQSMLLGCALVADETKSTFVWLMKTWLRAMGGQAPKVMITDQDRALKAAIEEVFPNTHHCFSLWHVLERIPESLAYVIKRHENFLAKFNKCILKSWTDEQFDMRWWKMVTRFELQDDEWIRSLYDDRKKWCSKSRNSFFDKYIHKKITLKELVRQYGTILQNRYEEEARADFDAWHKQPALRSPSPWEKQLSTVYTHAIFKKFQVEILGVVGCHPKKESEDGTTTTFRVQDCEKGEYFMVTWNEIKSEVSCFCHLFEYQGFLCRHAMIVLQICGLSSIPSRYVLKRWTKDAKSRQSKDERTERIQTRVQRYNDLCKQAIELSEEGSLSEETLKHCVNVNNCTINVAESSSKAHGLREEEDNQGSPRAKTNKKKNTYKKRKVQDSLQQMDNLSSDGMNLNGYYSAQQNVQGLVQLNLMEPPHDGYYVSQHSMQGLGQLDFCLTSNFSYSLQDQPHLRSAQLHDHDSASRHA